MNTKHHGLGVDIGRVIIEGDGPDTNFIAGSEDEAMRAPAMRGAIESLSRLVQRFGGHVWIVSKCGPKVEARSRAWLDQRRFFELTGIPREQIRFCKQRKDKALIALRLGLQFFVDDRVDVLVPMAGTVAHRFLFGATRSPDRAILATPTWEDVEAAIVRELDEREALAAGTFSAPGTPEAPSP